MKEKAILSSYFLAEFGRTMYFVVITWVLFDITQDPFYTGLLVSIGFVPGLLLNLLFGVVVDRFNRKTLAIIANLASSIALIYLVSIQLFHFLNVIQIFLVHMVLQVTGSLLRPSVQALVAEIFPRKQLPKIYSQAGASGIVGGLAGALVGGLLIATTSELIAFLVPLTAFLFATLTISLIAYTQQEKKEIKTSLLEDLKGGFTYLHGNQLLILLFVMMFIGQLVFHTSVGFLSAYTREFLQQTATIYGFLDATISTGGAVAGILGSWWWVKNKFKLHLRAFFIVGAGLLFCSLTTNILIAFIGFFLIGLGTTWIRILLQSVQQMATDSNYHGRMASFRMLCNQGSVVISGPILGWVASTWGSQFVYLSLVIPVGLGILCSLPLMKNAKFLEITIHNS
ncbi:MFS family permease [Salirhabdus euzebyi]|uniref:MFS family permease n=1 Tax=Salirhabdus euzebyi TaxID=394506 RepID=A0A841Q6W9_9BACI|nr:MFS transporter [Salirhabdus euzebyi]MBB6454094.1 MFS family permease [Salirhabdus euzebyi]